MNGFNAENMEINFEDFSVVFDKSRKSSEMAVYASPSGHLTLNKYLMEDIGRRTDSLNFGLYAYRKDKTILILSPKEPFSYSFPASGVKKDRDFTQSLVACGITLPAKYKVEWNEKACAWVGVLCGGTGKNALSNSLRKGAVKNK